MPEVVGVNVPVINCGVLLIPVLATIVSVIAAAVAVTPYLIPTVEFVVVVPSWLAYTVAVYDVPPVKLIGMNNQSSLPYLKNAFQLPVLGVLLYVVSVLLAVHVCVPVTFSWDKHPATSVLCVYPLSKPSVYGILKALQAVVNDPLVAQALVSPTPHIALT